MVKSNITCFTAYGPFDMNNCVLMPLMKDRHTDRHVHTYVEHRTDYSITNLLQHIIECFLNNMLMFSTELAIISSVLNINYVVQFHTMISILVDS